jgi:hypothetical protein
MQFGRSSERISQKIEQLELRLEELEFGAAEDAARAEAREPPPPDRGPHAKPKRKKLPGHFQVIRHVRPKYACAACDAITQAPAPAMPTPRGRATPGTLAHLLVAQYGDHLPLYRQSEIYAREALDRIAAVYAIEARAQFAPVAERMAHRTETAPLLEAFFAWAGATEARLSAKSALAEAFRYAIKRRLALCRFVTDGRLEADNNIAENAMRAIAVGRKNYLFAGADTGGDRAAAIYTIVQTARLNGVNPEAYRKDILTKIADGHPMNKLSELMPWSSTGPTPAQPP